MTTKYDTIIKWNKQEYTDTEGQMLSY